MGVPVTSHRMSDLSILNPVDRLFLLRRWCASSQITLDHVTLCNRHVVYFLVVTRVLYVVNTIGAADSCSYVMFVLFALPWKMSARCPVVRKISVFHWASSIGGTTMSVCGRKLVRHTPIIMMVLPSPISSAMKPPLTGRCCSVGFSRAGASLLRAVAGGEGE